MKFIKSLVFPLFITTCLYLCVSKATADSMTFDSGPSHLGFSFNNFNSASGTIWTADLANPSTISKNTLDGFNGFNLTSILWGTPFLEGNLREITSDRGHSQTFGPGSGTLTLNWNHIRWLKISRPQGGSGASGDIDNIIFTKVNLIPEMDIKGNGISIIDDDLTPSTVDGSDFESVNISGSSVIRTFSIINTGTADLLLTGIPSAVVTGLHAADFSVIIQPASTVSGFGGTTTFNLRFNPSAIGLRTATLSIANNDSDEDPYNFDIQGTGIEPEMEITGQGNIITDGDSTPNLTDDTDFGSSDITTETVVHIFTIQNIGNTELELPGTPKIDILGAHAGDFSITVQPTSPVASGGGLMTFTVLFNPLAVGLRTATLSIANNDSDEDPYNFDIQGTGTASPEIDISGLGSIITDGDNTPNSIDNTDFGNAGITTETVMHIFTIQNTGNAELELPGIPKVDILGAHAGDFSITVQPTSPVASGGGSMTFTVLFNPLAVGLRTAILSIANNDSDENPYNFDIQGNGIAPNLIVMKSNIGSPVLMGDTWEWYLIISNNGDQSADFSNGQTLLLDQLPTDNVHYGTVTVDNQTGITGTVSCVIDGSSVLNCSVNSGSLNIAALTGTFRVHFTSTPLAAGTFTNPTSGNCIVDPDNHVGEGDETDNNCNIDSVIVQHSAILPIQKIPALNTWSKVLLVLLLLLISVINLQRKI